MQTKNMKLFRNSNITGVAALLLLLPSQVCAEAYAPGTFSFKPLNVNIASFTGGKTLKNFKMTTIGTAANGNNVPVFHEAAAYHAPLSFGFAESDRGGYGYGAEAGYVVGWDTEIFARAGYNRETPTGQFVVGDMSLKFHNRSNYGFSFGARHYFDMKSSWKPFMDVSGGFIKQGDANATAFAHGRRSGSGVEFDDQVVGTYRLGKSATLYNFELTAGTDYEFTKNIAMSFAVAVRYSSRASGITTITTPQTIVNTPIANITVPSRSLNVQDNKPRWFVPVTVSLKFKL